MIARSKFAGCLAIILALVTAASCKREPGEQREPRPGLRRAPSEEAIAWPASNRFIVLWKDEWSDGPDAVQIRCAETGVYAMDSLGTRTLLHAGQDVCDATLDATQIDISPDEKALMVGDSQVRRIDVLSGSVARLASGVRGASFPSVSRDGRRIAFLGAPSPADSSSDQRGLYLSALDGSHPRLILSLKRRSITSGPSWSPDMRRLAISVYPSSTSPYEVPGEITVLDTGGSRARVVAAGYQPAWSPDGQWIAYLAMNRRTEADSSRTLVSSVRLVRPDGTGDRSLYQPADSRRFGAFRDRTVTGIPAGRLVWSPDGRSLAFPRIFEGRWTLWGIDVDGSRLRRLTSDEGSR